MDDSLLTRLTLVNTLVNQFILKNNIDIMKYTFEDFFDWYLKTYSIDLVFDFLPMSEEFLLGVTVKSKFSTAMFINKTLTKNRSNFSKCHELMHIIFDLTETMETQQFFNVENNPSFYSPEDYKKELLANAGAGMLMMPDVTVLEYLKTMKSFPLIAEENKMSRAALWNRMIEFGIQRCGFDYNLSVRAIKRLQDTGNRDVYHKFLYTWGSTRGEQIILDFENCIK